MSDKRILMVKNVDSVWMKLCGYCVKGRGNKDSVISIEFKTDALNNRKVMTIKLVEGVTVGIIRVLVLLSHSKRRSSKSLLI